LSSAPSIRGRFASGNQRFPTMATDFLEDKYDFKLKPEMRRFAAVPMASATSMTHRSDEAENVDWDELNGKDNSANGPAPPGSRPNYRHLVSGAVKRAETVSTSSSF
jgi:hypothetical protein